MDATELLKEDHRNVRKLFAAHESAGDNALVQKKSTAEKIFSELDVHTRIEEEIFYPAARDGRSTETDELVAEAYEEHTVAKTLISELRSMAPGDERWDAKMKVLQEAVEHHIEEEEGELFPKVREGLGSTYLKELGEKMSARKKELMAPSPSLTGSLTKLVTRAYDSLTGTSRPRGAAAKPKRATASATVKKASKSVMKAIAKTGRKAKRAGRAVAARAASSAKKARASRSVAIKKVRARAKTRASTGRARAAKVVKTAPKRSPKRRSARR